MLSGPTLASLIRLTVEAYRHSELNTLFLEHGVQDYDERGANKEDRISSVVRQLVARGADGEETLLDMIRSLLERINGWDESLSAPLLQNLQTDGWEYRDGRLIPTDAGPIELGQEISALETDLERSGLGVALNHYRQAVENLAEGNFEACNSQVRPFLEDLFKGAGEHVTSRSRNNAEQALSDLREGGFLDQKEYRITKALWDLSHDRGPHAGVSDEGEARYRLTLATATARYILAKLRDRG